MEKDMTTQELFTTNANGKVIGQFINHDRAKLERIKKAFELKTADFIHTASWSGAIIVTPSGDVYLGAHNIKGAGRGYPIGQGFDNTDDLIRFVNGFATEYDLEVEYSI